MNTPPATLALQNRPGCWPKELFPGLNLLSYKTTATRSVGSCSYGFIDCYSVVSNDQLINVKDVRQHVFPVLCVIHCNNMYIPIHSRRWWESLLTLHQARDCPQALFGLTQSIHSLARRPLPTLRQQEHIRKNNTGCISSLGEYCSCKCNVTTETHSGEMFCLYELKRFQDYCAGFALKIERLRMTVEFSFETDCRGHWFCVKKEKQ